MWWSWEVARAGVTEELADATARYPTDAVIACSPLSDLMAVVPKLPVPPALAAGSGRWVMELTDPALAAELGLDPAGGITMVTREGAGAPVEVSLPFAGTEEQALALARRFDRGAEGGEGVWTLSVRGQPFVVVHEPGRRWTLVAGTSRPPVPEAELPEALRDLPEVPGCGVWIPELPPTGKLAFEVDAMAGFVPLRGGAPGLLRVVLDRPLGPLWSTFDAPLPAGHGPARPDTVATLSLPLQDLIGGMAEAQGMPEVSRQLRRHVSLPSGVSAVSWGKPEEGGEWMAMTLVLNRRGHPFSPHRLSRLAVRLLRDQGEVARVGRDGLRATVGGKQLYARFAPDGRVAVGGSPLAPSVALADQGVPWLDDEALADARSSAFAIRSEGPMSLDAVLRPSGERSLELVVSLSLDPASAADLREAVEPLLQLGGQMLRSER